MNKEYILGLLESLELLEGEYYILGSAAMVIRGLKEKARDLDLCLSPKAMEELATRVSFSRANSQIPNLYRVNDEIEFFVDPKENFRMEYAHGYPLEDIRVLLEYKIKRNKPKDIEDIETIKKYLDENN